MILSRFLRKSCPFLVVSLLAGCGESTSTSNGCPDQALLPSYSLRTFNADTILLGISQPGDCPMETMDTGHIAMRVGGYVERMDGSVDSVKFEYIDPGWIMDGTRPTALLWTAPTDDIAHLRGVSLFILGQGKESERILTFEAKQDPASY